MKRALLQDARGGLYVEALGGLTFLFVSAFAVAQLTDGIAHQLLVRRAASVAVRAAVVVLPDDGRHYGDPRQRTVDKPVEARARVIEDAARAVLRGSPSVAATRVSLAGDAGPNGAITATVEADYACPVPVVQLLCGSRHTLTLRASATLPSQYAPYRHRQGG
ncbi:MAG: hypothetical protein ABW352_11030 [Polyangiales bacterium]